MEIKNKLDSDRGSQPTTGSPNLNVQFPSSTFPFNHWQYCTEIWKCTFMTNCWAQTFLESPFCPICIECWCWYLLGMWRIPNPHPNPTESGIFLEIQNQWDS